MPNNDSVVFDEVQVSKVLEANRLDMMPRYFGARMLNVENFIYNVMGHMCESYTGGYWEFFELSNGGFYMAPTFEGKALLEASGNYFSQEVTCDAAGIIACLYAFCYFAEEDNTGRFANLYHNLRDYVGDHPEASLIYGAID